MLNMKLKSYRNQFSFNCGKARLLPIDHKLKLKRLKKYNKFIQDYTIYN